jgi:site-specific recombinase XerD
MLHDSYFTLSFIARKARALRNGEYPIFARISVSGQVAEMNIGRSVVPANWDQKRAMSTGRGRRDLELNKYIEVVRARFLEIHNMLVREGMMVNPKILRDHFLGTVEKPKMLCEVFREANKQRRAEYERGDMGKPTYERWVRCVVYLEEFMQLTRNVSDIPIKDVTKGFVLDFEHFLRMNKNAANNTAVRYLRYLKNVMQYAIANKWTTEDPFLGKRFKRTVADREAITEAELKRMMELDLKSFPRLEVVRDTFVFCCFSGLAFIDIQTLKRNDISTDANGNMWIRKKREKTNELSVVSLLEVPRQLMEKYKGHPKVMLEGVVIPVISNQRTNAYLKEIADLAKIERHLTTHLARHTFASVSLNNHVPIETISKMLGHSDIKTTQIYAKMIDSTIYEDMAAMRDKFDCVMMN